MTDIYVLRLLDAWAFIIVLQYTIYCCISIILETLAMSNAKVVKYYDNKGRVNCCSLKHNY